MADAATVPAKYIFLDVVGFTYNRSVEAQSDIVHSLNEIVKASLDEYSIHDDNRIFLPTGDGICIALLNIECLHDIASAYDIHVKIALGILKRLEEHNTSTEDVQRKFKLRIGINENIDNLVEDVNGNRNVAGDGINLAQRVMSLADGNQILLSPSVFATLRVRERYMNASFKGHPAVKIKHGLELSVYQLIAPDNTGLDIETPERFKTPEKVEPRFTKLVAYYFAHAIKNEQFFLGKVDSSVPETAGVVLLYLLATDSVEMSESRAIDAYEPDAPKFGSNIEEQFKYFDSLPYWVLSNLRDYITDKHLSKFYGNFEADRFGFRNYIFVNQKGKEKLKREYPDVWNAFGLDTVR